MYLLYRQYSPMQGSDSDTEELSKRFTNLHPGNVPRIEIQDEDYSPDEIVLPAITVGGKLSGIA